MTLTNQNNNNNTQFRGLPPLRGGSGSSSYKGGTGKNITNTQIKKRNFLTAGLLFIFVGTIYITALRKMSQGAQNQLSELEDLDIKRTK